MWVQFAFLFLVGTTLVDSTTWKPNYTYQYMVRSRTLTGLKASPQFNGILMKADLKIHVIPDALIVQIINAQQASLHKTIPAGWETFIRDYELKYINLPVMRNPIKVMLRHGQIDEILATRDTDMDQVNIMKGILSHLQLQLNAKTRENLKINPYQIYQTNEQTVSSYCDTTYDIMPISKRDAETYNPSAHFVRTDEDRYLYISKYKDYDNCIQEQNYRFTVANEMELNPSQKYVKKSSWTNMMVSQKESDLTIWSSVMKNIINVRPEVQDMENFAVYSLMNLTLVDIKETRKVPVISDLVSTGNLTYVYIKDDDWLKSNFDLENLGLKFQENKIVSAEQSSESSESSETVSYQNEHPTSTPNYRKYIRSTSSYPESVEKYSSESENNREHGYLIRKRELNENIFSQTNSWTSRTPSQNYLVEKANSLIHDIAREILVPEEILKQHTLEKYTILIGILRRMNESALGTVENMMEMTLKPVKSEQRIVIARKVFRDAVTDTGTTSALKVIRRMILMKEIKNIEAARILGRLPKVMRQPTQEYIKIFGELIKRPEVKYQLFVNTTAPYAFSEILYYVLVRDNTQNYGKFQLNIWTKKDKKELIHTYIPYLANELTKAYNAKHNSGIVTYTIALGNIAHLNVIKVFKPYLEGVYNLTKFQRTIMVGAMTKVCLENKEIVRPIMYKIYENERAYYEVRVMAVNILMRTDLPLYMLRRMVERTYKETSPQVNNAVITGIRSLAQLKEQKYEKVARHARYVEKFINPNVVNDVKYSSNILQDYINKPKDLKTLFTMDTIGTETKTAPKIMNIKIGTNTPYRAPVLNVGYATSNVKILIKIIKWITGILDNFEVKEKLPVDELAKRLNIVLDQEETLEGTVTFINDYGTYLIVFDKEMIENVLNDISQDSAQSIMSNYQLIELINSEFVIGSPSELGMIVTHCISMPKLAIIRNRANLKKEKFELQLETDITIGNKQIHRLGFISPFNKQQHFAIVDVDMQMRIPFTVNLQINRKTKNMRLEYKPLANTHQAKLWQYRVIPYTGNTEYPYFEPIHVSKNIQPIIIEKRKKTTTQFGKFIMTHEVDNFKLNVNDPVTPIWKQNILRYVINILFNEPLHYKETEMRWNCNPEEDNSIFISINYDYLFSNRKEEKSDNIDTIMTERWNKTRNVNLLKKFDFHVQVPNNNINLKCDGSIIKLTNLLVNRINMNCSTASQWHYCGTLQTDSTYVSCPIMNFMTEKMRRLRASILYGYKTCNPDNEIIIEGIQNQSEDAKKKIMTTELYKNIRKEIAEENEGMLNSKERCKITDFMDEMFLSVRVKSKTNEAVLVPNPNKRIVKWLSNQLIYDVNIEFPKSTETAMLSSKPIWTNFDLNITRPIFSKVLNVDLTTPLLNLRMPINLRTLPVYEISENFIDSFWGIENEKMFCTLGKTKVKTFTDIAYSVKPSKCARVLMINPSKTKHTSDMDTISKIWDTPEQNIAILYRDIEDNKREIIIMHQNKVFQITPFNNYNKVLINGKEIELNKNIIALSEDSDITIVKMRPNLYKISIESAGVVLWYDHEYVQIQASNAYNGQIRGMCGAKNNNMKIDLVAPKRCIVRIPERMAPLYTLYDDKCSTDSDWMQIKEAEKDQCYNIDNRLNNVIDPKPKTIQQFTDIVSKFNLCSSLRIYIIKRNNEVCFSTRPVRACLPGCTAEAVVEKPIDFHCFSRTPEIAELKKRIEMGANPDFSTKSVSTTTPVKIPISCMPESQP